MPLLPKAILTVALSSSMLMFNPLSASEFNDAYKAYIAAVEAKNNTDIEQYALQAYQLGTKKFASDSLDVAMLALNAGDASIQNVPSNHDNAAQASALKKQAFALYKVALANYKKEYGDEAIELIDPLMGLADSSNHKDARQYLNDALAIAEDSDNPMLLANTQQAYFDMLSTSRFYTRTVRNYMLDAYKTYQQLLPENSIKRVLAAYTVGSIEYAEKHYDKAEIALLYVIKQFEALDYNHPYELAAHAKLVQLYELQGHSDKSTQHCIAIGNMQPWRPEQEQTPLFRVNPNYPASYARKNKEGSIQVSFTVNEMGFVTEPAIINSKGGSAFEKASLEAVKKWRYAPKFIDGKAVAAKSSVQLDYTIRR